jgi:hypothetical protein
MNKVKAKLKGFTVELKKLQAYKKTAEGEWQNKYSVASLLRTKSKNVVLNHGEIHAESLAQAVDKLTKAFSAFVADQKYQIYERKRCLKWCTVGNLKNY